MPYSRPRPLLLSCYAFVATLPTLAVAADDGSAAEQELVIEIEGAVDPGFATDIVIEEPMESGSGEPAELIIEQPGETQPADAVSTTAPAVAAAVDPAAGQFDVGIDDVRIEYGHFTRSGAEADNYGYGKISVVANWQSTSAWEVQVAARVDAFNEDGPDSSTKVKADYGDSFVRYRGDDIRLTFGAQTVVWGRLDELPLSDRVSTADLTRGVLDNLENRRRSNPMLRAETFLGGGKVDLVWLFDFRAAELPDRESVWYPINSRTGRILGVDPNLVPPATVQNAVVVDDEPSGDGGFGARYTRAHSFADIGVTVARSRQSTPYFRPAGVGRFEAEYPRSWAYGADAAIDAAGATWRLELLYSSDNPVTRRDLSYTTAPAIAWGGGVEFFPGDGDTRVNLQLIGMNLIDAGAVIDRKEIYSINGEIEAPFDRERWRAQLDFYVGLDKRDFYLNPEIAFLGWEPHEIYVALHYLDGDDNTIGGFYEDNSSINVGWRASF